MKSQAVVDLVVVFEVFANRVDDKPDYFRVLVHKKGDGEVSLGFSHDLLLLTICFSLYLLLLTRFTASICPTSTL